jgi:hypothetical protein
MIQPESHSTQWRFTTKPLEQLDIERVRQRGWWIVLLLAVGTIVLATFVHSWADCRFFYQAELDQYLAHPDTYGRPPQMASMPLITVLIRTGGQLLSTIAAWIGWAGGLYAAVAAALCGRLCHPGRRALGCLPGQPRGEPQPGAGAQV